MDKDDYNDLCNEVFGREMDPQDLFRMAGMGVAHRLFPGIRPTITGISELGQRTRVRVNFKYPGKIELDREFQKDKQGRPYVRNELFRIDDPELKKRGGIGQEIFSSQVDEAIQGGMAFISCKAAGDYNMSQYGSGNNWIGYYTWPRFGYDAHIEPRYLPAQSAVLSEIIGRSPDDIKTNGINLSELMMTPEGRELWRKKGESVEVKFDLSEGSLSRRILSAYRKEKGVDDPEGPDRFRNQERTGQWPTNEMSGRSSSSRHGSTSTMRMHSTVPGRESAERTRRNGDAPPLPLPRGVSRGTWGKENPRRPARFSRIHIPDDAEFITARQVAALIADQYRNAPDRFSSLDQVIQKFISSPRYYLMEIPTWLPSPYQRIEDDDPAYTSGPIVVDINKHGKLKKLHGAFGQSLEISILDGQHRQHAYLNEGIDKIQAYVGERAIPIIEGFVRDYAPYRRKFADALDRYYTGPSSTTLRGVIDASKPVGLTLDQVDEIFENFRSGIYFNVNTGEFEQREVPENMI